MNTLFVLVLYNTKIEQSETILSLLKINEEFFSKSDLFIYDNGIENQRENPLLKKNFSKSTYIHNPDNPGISYAYNTGFKKAIKEKKKWITLLDQDSSFHSSFIKELNDALTIKISSDVVAIVPHIILNKKTILSPQSQNKIGINKSLLLSCNGVHNKKITALNTCTTINVDFLNSLNGFNNYFNLDMLYHWLFNQIYYNKKKVLVLHSTIYHNLSFFDKDYLEIERYKLLLKKEAFLKKHYESTVVFVFYKAGLLYRAIKQYFLLHRKEHAIFTIRQFFNKKNMS